MIATLPILEKIHFPYIQRNTLSALQVNIGYKCNQRCLHCHVNAGPTRTEMMTEENLRLIPKVIQARNIQLLDITGGAPELHSAFKWLVKEATALDVHVIDRCNLTVLLEPGQEDTAAFLRDHRVEINASLPCYSQDNVDKQRGEGVFGKSIAALKLLNRLGYGIEKDLPLNLVYNPQGPTLPPPQQSLQQEYKQRLREDFGIEFTGLLVITNMPIQRFGSTLVSKNQFNDYMQLLQDNHNDQNLESVMCKGLVSVDWNGALYDCDFNQQLGIPMQNRSYKKLHLRDLLVLDPKNLPIKVAGHCFGCTAGCGSSCGGALS